MALQDYWPFNRRVFASVGSNPSYKKDEPRSYGEGVIKRLKLTDKYGGIGGGDFEKHIGDPKTYMNVYLSDPLVRTLIDLPCLYASKDGWDIVTDDETLREEITQMFNEINIDQLIYGWLRNARIFGGGSGFFLRIGGVPGAPEIQARRV